MAYTALDGDPSTPAGLLAALPSAEIVPGPGDLLRPAADPGVEGRPAPARQWPGPAARCGPSTPRQDHRPMADARAEPVPSGSMEATPADRPARPWRRERARRDAHRCDRCAGSTDPLCPTGVATPTPTRPISLAHRLRQPRTILSIVVPLAIIAVLPVPQPRAPVAGPRAHPQAPTRRSSSRRSSSSTSGSRCAATAGRRLLRWTGFAGPREGLDRDHLTCRGSSTASSRPSSATSTAPTCSR